MATSARLGFSQNITPALAVQEAARQVTSAIDQQRIDCAFVFTTAHYKPQEFLPALFEELHHTRIVGCSSPAVMINNQIHHRGIGILAVCSDNIKFETSAVNFLSQQDILNAGRTLFKSTLTDFGQQQRKLFFCIANGLLDNAADLITGVREESRHDIPVFFAGCSDNYRFKKTYQFHKDQVMSDGAVSLVLGGRLQVGIGVGHGFSPLGKPRSIDKTEGNCVLSINGRPACSLYEEFFGAEATTLKNGLLGPINFRYPLGFRCAGASTFSLRSVLGIRPDGALICQDHIPPHAEVHIMIGNQDSFLAAAEDAARQVREQMQGQRPSFIVVVESLSRLRFLSRQAHQEAEAIQDILGKNVPLLGMYSLDEYSTLDTEAPTDRVLLQNGNIMVLAVC